MKDKIYVVMSKKGVIKMTKTPPAIKPTERTFVVNVIVPDKIFETPQFIGNMIIKEAELDVIDKLEFELNLLKKKAKEDP